MSEVYSIEQLKKTLIPDFKRNNVRKATLFGSYSKGNATEHSDVDLLVDSGLRGLQFFGLLDEVCEALTCRVDLIDTYDVETGSPVDTEIKRTGVVLYER